MTLTLQTNVVYAILAAVVAVVIIVNCAKILRIKMTPDHEYEPRPYDQETAVTSSWQKTQP